MTPSACVAVIELLTFPQLVDLNRHTAKARSDAEYLRAFEAWLEARAIAAPMSGDAA